MREDASASPIGLDIGTSRIVMARHSSEEYAFASELNAFVALPFRKMTRSMLTRENIPHRTVGSEILVYGNESERLADLFHMETRRPMAKGMLNPEEPTNVETILHIVESLAPESERKGRTVVFSVPAPALGAEDGVTYHEATLKKTLSSLGYQPKPINEGLAVIYGELEDSNYTGIGVSCGSGMCNVCLAYLSAPALSFSVPKAGDFVDQNAASVTGELATRIRILKEQTFYLNGSSADKIQQALSVYYEDMIQSLVGAMHEVFSNGRNIPKIGRAVPIVLSGGSALPKGFRDRFEKIFRETTFPLQVSEIRLAADPLHATAKGALVAGLSEM
jgi:hypothetical protein